MTYFFMLVSVFLWAFVVAAFLMREADLNDGAKAIWVLTLASAATFLFHNIW